MLDCIILPYSYHRIKSIFKEDYHYTLERMFLYKDGRHGSPVHYKLVDSDGQTVLSNVTLQALRAYLTSEDYPLCNN